MISRSLAIGLLAAGCMTAAAGGSYMAVRQNASSAPQASPAVSPVIAPALPPVTETEGVVAPSVPGRESASPQAPPQRETVPPAKALPPASERRTFPGNPSPRNALPRRPGTVRASTVPAAPAAGTPAAIDSPVPASAPTGVTPDTSPASEPPTVSESAPRVDASSRPAEPTIEEVVIPASAVVGLELETTVTSERAQLEDRVDARVTRDVYADGRMAIPAGSRVIGAVTMVERGGKVKERARLGVRFHTLVLANGRQVSLRTETVYRDGESPSAESSRKIGGAAIGGAVLGAIMGGGKGAIAGATVGAAGGTAAVMAGGRNAATLASGSIITVKLSAPASFDVARQSS